MKSSHTITLKCLSEIPDGERSKTAKLYPYGVDNKITVSLCVIDNDF